MGSFLPGTASLIEELDKKLLVLLRDGRKLFGIMRSFDQFANIVLESTVERIYVGDTYGDVERGLFVIRGENVALLGEVDVKAEQITEDHPRWTKVGTDEILAAQKAAQKLSAQDALARRRLLMERGINPDEDVALY